MAGFLMDNHLFALSLQMGVSGALSFLLLEIYKKLRHESFVFYWALFWACQAAAPVFGLSYLHRTESNLWSALGCELHYCAAVPANPDG